MELIYDENVNGEVWCEKKYPNIRYFKIWGDYKIDEYNILVLGGAYSVDKYYRQEKGWPWFESEQMTWEEQVDAATHLAMTEKHYDFVFSHTCPISWEPTDLFINGIDQSKVDKTMENWLDGLKDYLDWGVWCFGHYHADRLERPHVEQYYNDVEDLDRIYFRWRNVDYGGDLEWWLVKSPNFYMGV